MNLLPPKFTPVSQNVYKKIDHLDFDIIISCGRKSVIPSIHLKSISNKKVFNIHIQDPKVDLNHFDFVIAPEHDGIKGSNVISTKGAIHYLTKNEIEENKDYLNSFIKRDDELINDKILFGDYEIEVSKLIIISKSKTLPFQIEDSIETDENIRLKFRYLDLRRQPMKVNIMTRSNTFKSIRSIMNQLNIFEIDTPTLIKSTPEGAKDFLVPS